jgi:hypothetical protein
MVMLLQRRVNLQMTCCNMQETCYSYVHGNRNNYFDDGCQGTNKETIKVGTHMHSQVNKLH